MNPAKLLPSAADNNRKVKSDCGGEGSWRRRECILKTARSDPAETVSNYMADQITISPVTRVEGHLGIKVEVEADRVARAFVSGEMFRGFEVILRGRDPLDAQHITHESAGCARWNTAWLQCWPRKWHLSTRRRKWAARSQPHPGRELHRLSYHATFYLLSGLNFVDVR